MTARIIPFPSRAQDAPRAPSAGVSVAEPAEPRPDRPTVSLELLMAASGRCSCEECIRNFRRGNRAAGRIDARPALRLVR